MISIIIPVYNCQKYIHDCLNSILNQTVNNFEVLCIDDASTDNSLDILKQYAARDSRIKVIQSNQHLGAGPARNLGISKASGDFLLFCDADDIYPSYALSKMKTVLAESSCDMCIGNIKFMSPDMSHPIFPPFPLLSSHIDEFKIISPCDDPSLWIPWYHQRVMFKKSFLVENNIYYPNLLRGQDPPMLAKSLCLADSVVTIPDTVYKYRASSSIKKFSHQQFEDYIKHIKETIRIFDSFNWKQQADIYIQLMAFFTDGFSTFKAYPAKERKQLIDYCLTCISERRIVNDTPPYFFDKNIQNRLISMKYGIFIYGFYRLYTLYGNKIKKYF